MTTPSWYEEHRLSLGDWAPRLEAFVAGYDNPTEGLRRVGRYVLWCIENDLDPAQRIEGRVTEYLNQVRLLIDGNRPFSEGTKRRVRHWISRWHDWLMADG